MSSGCGDVLSLADLQTAKKHQIFEAEVITGKQGGVASGADIDYATNAVTGQTQKTLPAVLRDAGFSPVSWDFSTGGTLTVTDRGKVVYDHVSKTWYSYAGTLPVTVPAGFNPVGNADWKPQTDPDLRNDLSSSQGAGMVGSSFDVNVQEALDVLASDISLFGYQYSSGLDAKTAILAAIAKTGSAHLSGDITVSTFDWPQGAKLTGKSTITYTRRPSLPCVLDSYTHVDKTLQKGTYVFGDYDIWDMLQLKTAGFNIIMHYGYAFHDGGNFEKLCNAAEAVGIDVIINSPNDTPPVSDISLGQRDVVKGFYIFDEPQHQGISVSSQNARLSAWRNATSKPIVISDNGVWGFQNDTIADGYDIILVDSYYIASETDSDNKMFAVVGWEELSYKSKHAKLIPTVGLFTGDALTNKEKQISFAKKFFAMGDGSYFCFAWDSSTADPAQNDIISDQDFYDAAKTLNGVWANTPYHNEVYLFGPGVGLNGALLAYDQLYSSADVKPFAVVNVGSATDERRQTFSDSGFAFRNNGGNLALQIRNKGYLIVSMAYRNHADGSTPSTLTVFTTPDDFYSSSDVYSVTLNPNSGKTSGIEMDKKSSIGLRITPSASSAFFHKFISGYFITSTWNGSNF